MRKKPTGYSSTTPVSAVSDAVASEMNSAGTTTSTYDHRGRRKTVDAPNTTAADGSLLANVTNTLYFPDGSVKETNGDQTYRTTYTYDYAARTKTMATYRISGVADTTTWNYESWSGRLSSKRDAMSMGPSYTYSNAGRLKTRTWARGYRTRYDYVSGRLTATRYFTSAASDTGSNAGNDYYAGDIGYTYNRPGQRLRAVTAFTSSQPATSITYAYNPSAPFQLLAETNAVDPDLTFASALNASGVSVTEGPVLPSLQRTVSHKTDTLLRPTGSILLDGLTTELETTLAYHPTQARLAQVTARLGGTDRNFYYMSYQYGSYHRVQNLTGPASSVYNYYDSLRGTLSSKSNYATPSWNTVSSYVYETPNAIGQRTSVDAYGTAFSSSDTADWQWKYNLRGELASARNQPLQASSTASRFYEFDGIGNRQRQCQGVFADAGGTLTSYTPNALNQYTTITTASTVYPYHDPDGNLTSGPLPTSLTGASLGWNGENRLSYISPWVSGSAWAYYLHDALGRRVMKTVTPSGGSATRTYAIYDGWNLLAEYTGAVHTTGTPPLVTLQRSYAWGTDLSGTAEGAGGVGGLLAAQLHTGANAGVYYPLYDGNGNVSEYLNSTGAVAAHYQYGPFGEPLTTPTGLAAEMPFRFSTKYQDVETGLLYYGYRYYDPLTGRWLNRDPMAERGGVNLYGFLGNNTLARIDYLGLVYEMGCDWTDRVKTWLKKICPLLKTFAEKDGIDPLVLANSLAEEHAMNGFDSLHGIGHNAVDGLFMLNSGLGNNMTQMASGHTVDTGPANINVDSARKILAARGWSSDYGPAKWWVFQDEGAVDVGSALQKIASEQTLDIWSQSESGDEQIALQTNAWRMGPDKFRSLNNLMNAKDGYRIPLSSNDPNCLRKCLAYLRGLLDGCKKCRIPYR